MLLSPTSLRVRHSAVWLTLSFLIATLLVTILTQKSSEATSLSMPDVLVVHTANWQTPAITNWVLELNDEPRLGEVSAFNTETTALAQSNLLGIEVVLVQSNYDFKNTDEVGNLLADFVDQGGRVIEFPYAFACTQNTSGPQNWGIGGRWEDEGYAAIVPIAPLGGNCAQYQSGLVQTLQVVVESSPFLTNVGILEITQNNNISLQAAPGATLLAKWNNPTDMPAIAVGSNCVMGVTMHLHAVMDLNKYSLQERTSVKNLFVNLATLSCAASDPTTTTTGAPTTTVVPTTTTTIAPTTTVTPLTTTTLPPPPSLATIQSLPTAPIPLVEKTTLYAGAPVTVSVDGFIPFEYVQLIVASTPQVIGSGYADAQGIVTITGNIPQGLTSGTHTLGVYAPQSGIGFTQSITVTTTLLPATGSTGSHNTTKIAFWLLLVGTAAIVAIRRRIF